MSDNIFEQLRARLDSFPMGAPHAPEIIEILSTLFTPEEARSALLLAAFPESLPELLVRTGADRDTVLPHLESMADKGLVLHLVRDGVPYYSLLPLVPGMFELQFMKAETSPGKKRLAELFDAYYHSGWGKASFGHKQAFARVIPIEKHIPPLQEVQPYEKVSELIAGATSMALTNCYCRHEAELLGHSCGAPKDVCMIFGPFADFTVERGFARRATREEMKAALDTAEKAGLVHVSDNVQNRINFICNCCGCCCGILGTITKLKISTGVAVSRYIVTVDEDCCTGCGACEDRCHVDAIHVGGDEDVAQLDGPGHCIGCGLCVSACPTGALSMKVRPDWTEPKRTFREVTLAIAAERGVKP